MTEQIDAARDFPSQLQANEWNEGVRIVICGVMRAPVRDGQVSLEAHWQAEVFYSTRQRKPSFRLVAESPEAVLRDLAMLAAGELEAGS